MFLAETTSAIPDSLMLRVRPTKVNRPASPILVNDAGGRNLMVTSSCTARRRWARRPGSVFIRRASLSNVAERKRNLSYFYSLRVSAGCVFRVFRGVSWIALMQSKKRATNYRKGTRKAVINCRRLNE
jgi:hypothetical protein